MKKIYSIFILLCFTEIGFSQRANFIILVNDELLYKGEIANLYIIFDSIKNEKYYVNHEPGDLILDEKVLAKINSDTLKFHLRFDYYTYKKGQQQIANFDIELSKRLLSQSYLIANVFDFRNKKYKHWYQWHTKKNYLVQLIFNGGGTYIKRI